MDFVDEHNLLEHVASAGGEELAYELNLVAYALQAVDVELEALNPL